MLKDVSKNVTLNIQILIFIEKLIDGKLIKLISQELTQSKYFLIIYISKSFNRNSQSNQKTIEKNHEKWNFKKLNLFLITNKLVY